MSIVRTFTGTSVDLLDPNPNAIRIEDIAHHLAKLDRYNGAAPYPYSVGQHSLLVAELLPPDLQLWGLLHDATEAFLGDVVSPLKGLLPDYRRIEEKLHQAVCAAFGLQWPRPQAVKDADRRIMSLEMIQVHGWQDAGGRKDLPSPPEGIVIKPMTWVEVKDSFLKKFTMVV